MVDHETMVQRMDAKDGRLDQTIKPGEVIFLGNRIEGGVAAALN